MRLQTTNNILRFWKLSGCLFPHSAESLDVSTSLCGASEICDLIHKVALRFTSGIISNLARNLVNEIKSSRGVTASDLFKARPTIREEILAAGCFRRRVIPLSASRVRSKSCFNSYKLLITDLEINVCICYLMNRTISFYYPTVH